MKRWIAYKKGVNRVERCRTAEDVVVDNSDGLQRVIKKYINAGGEL